MRCSSYSRPCEGLSETTRVAIPCSARERTCLIALRSGYNLDGPNLGVNSGFR